ncbi:MAG: recombinase family protein, partial [Betaproteobacteria bacterium]
MAKLTRSSVTFYYQYFQGNRKRFLPIGPYDSKAERGKTLLQARDQAHAWSMLYRSGVTDLHGHLAERETELQGERKRKLEEAQRKVEETQRSSLSLLLEAYSGHLEREGKQSAADVRRIFKLHVLEVEPRLAAQRASEIEVDEFVALLARLTSAGKGRTAAKLRSYLRAAYSLALKSKTDPDAPLAMRSFRITANPLASIGALSRYNRARSRTLNAEELRNFLERLQEAAPSPKKDAVMLCLVLGGQRPAQLLRARLVDLDLGGATLTLQDGKGARLQPRQHVLPLNEEAKAMLARLAERSSAFDADATDRSPLLFTNDGKRPLRLETVSVTVTEIVDTMMKARELRERFELRDLRQRGITTKAWTTQQGASRSGKLIEKANVYKMFHNSVYIGLASYKDRRYPGQHEPIIERKVWNQVHEHLAEGGLARKGSDAVR